MQLNIHLTDGQQRSFTISDGQASENFLKTVKYWEVFDRPVLRIHDGKDTWTFNPNSIEKIHFLTKEAPDWQPPENIISSKCISPETWRRKLALLDAKPAGDGHQFDVGKFFNGLLDITLASGTIDYFEYMVMLRERREQMINLYNIFQKVEYTIPCETGGFVLLNPKCIVCIRMHPAPPEEQDCAWLVDGLTEYEAV